MLGLMYAFIATVERVPKYLVRYVDVPGQRDEVRSASSPRCVKSVLLNATFSRRLPRSRVRGDTRKTWMINCFRPAGEVAEWPNAAVC